MNTIEIKALRSLRDKIFFEDNATMVKEATEMEWLRDVKRLGLILAGWSILVVASVWLTPETPNPESISEPILFSPACIDYSSYWSSWRILLAGEDPYQSSSYPPVLGYRRPPELLMYNPPWAVILTAPTAWLPLQPAAFGWMGFNLIIIFMAARFALKAVNLNPRPLKVALSAFIFGPVALCLYFGQFSIVLAFAISLLWWSLCQKRFFWAGVALALMTLKPHLFFIPVCVLGAWFLKHRCWSMILGGAVTTAYLLIASTALSITSVSDWWACVEAGHAFIRVSSTMVSWIRLGLFEVTGHLPDWPLKAVPLTALAITLLWFWRRRGKIEWKVHFYPLLCLSLLFSSYGWAYDHSVLVGMHACWVAHVGCRHARSTQMMIAAWSALALQILWVCQLVFLSKDLHYLAWLPAALLTLWIIANPLLGSEKKASS